MRRHHHEEKAHERAHDEGEKEALTVSRIDDDEIAQGLSAIYGEERDDLQTVAKAQNPLTRFLIRAIGVLFVLCLIGFGGYFVYSTWFSGSRDGKPLALSFVTADELKSGASAVIELDYANQTAYPLTAVTIDLNVPSGFVLVSSVPEVSNATDLSWDLGTIGSHSDGKIVLTGIWNADVPSTTGIQALATYKPANYNAQFHDIATKTVATNTSTTLVTIDPVDKARVGESTTYTIHVQNSGTEGVSAPQVAVTLPTGFFIASSTPALEPGGSSTWTLSDLLPGVEQTIAIVGAYAADASGVQTLTAVSGIPGTRFSPQTTASISTTVEPSALSVTMVGNGTSGNVSADPGSLLRLSLRIDNTSDAAISNATALLDFTAEDNLPIDWSSAVVDAGKITAKGIVFDAKAIGTLAPLGYVLFNLAIPLKSDLSAVSSEFSVAFSATSGANTVSAAPLTVSVNSEAQITSTLRYFDDEGAPLGSGPLPPVAGQATHYRAIWQIGAGSHGLRDVTASATLPEGVTWDDFSTATSGTVTYDSSTRIIRWTLSSIPAGGVTVEARMSLSLVPTPSQVGTVPTIVGKIALQAKDELTSASLERSADAVTTACDGDTFAEGKGIVAH